MRRKEASQSKTNLLSCTATTCSKEDYYVDELFGWANGELLDSDDYEEACEELADEANAWYAEHEITPDD